jgi:multiple antibiotic resistance protein
MEHLFSDFVLFFIVIDPIGVAAMFVALTHDMERSYQRRVAVEGTVLSAVILFTFFFGGNALLRALGIGIPAFRIAGGLLLLLLSVDMILARHSGLRATTRSEEREAARKEDISVFPLAFPLIAGPGALTTVLLMASSVKGPLSFAGIAGVLAVVLTITWLALLYAPVILRFLGETGINVVSRLLGVILTALAVQYIIDGLRLSLFAGTAGG